ncbi:MAG: RnfABCDGE type electron transport complex subunit D [Deltaproteobacteria bacterium]|nr:RnfABCDGE type electron transport complex subunit D [Deltaproteobacteria bacterium]
MADRKLFVASHAPFWHNGSGVSSRSFNMILAAMPAVIMGIMQFGASALGVVALSVSSAMLWELLMNRLMKRPVSIGDGNAAVIGLIFGMLLPSVMPWWAILTGTFIAIVVGKQIFGGIGCNPLNPSLVAVAILTLSWNSLLDFDEALLNFDPGFYMVYPLGALKHFGVSAISNYNIQDLIMGRQSGGIGSTFGLGLIIGGVYLIARGHIRWEISVSFLAGIFLTSWIFNIADPSKYTGPVFHVFTGYTLIGAFFLATEDSSSPVNFIPMLLYGFIGGIITILIRNIGAFADGTVFAILMMNIANPLLDRIKPRAMGKGIEYA